MKILIISQYFWPENFRINDLGAGLVERGHEVTVLTGIPNYPDGHFFPGYSLFRNLRQDYCGVRIIRVPLIARGAGGRLRLMLNYASFAFFASMMAPFFCRGNFDVILVYEPSPVTVGIPAVVLKKLKGIPLFFWVQDLWPESLSATGAVHSRTILDGVKRLVRFIYERCDRILVQSTAFIPMIEEYRVAPGRIIYFPNSVEKIYKPMPAESGFEGLQRLPSGFRIMFAGNIGAAQDFESILAAAVKLREYKDIQWIILGDGRSRRWVEGQIAKQGISDCFHLLGRHPMETMPYYFSFADVLLVTLKRDPIFALTIPAKIQSYMACGKPIIAALDGEGGRLVSESGAGLSSPAEDADALAAAVLAMYQMPRDQREKMGKCGIHYCVENFDRDMLMTKLEGWMQDVAHGRKTGN
ncbi:MAG: glycosyltransferase WbuB [Deltaproteobacteria bacterium HGW-Deltaproteobacteria-6]|jgi:glycosyltransferase involved in cell wall biosynthesis|nr:MAG: glycosyltransferase WbuB [Deltaproteobacteria bacterium HGW-Deltaproteobacteria-6]